MKDEQENKNAVETSGPVAEEKPSAPAETGQDVPGTVSQSGAVPMAAGPETAAGADTVEKDKPEKSEVEVLVVALSTKFGHYVVGRAIFAPPRFGVSVPDDLRSVDDIEAIEDVMYCGERYIEVGNGMSVVQPVCTMMRVPQYILFGKFMRNQYTLRADKNDFVDVHFVNNMREKDAIGISRAYYTLSRLNTYEAYQRFEEEMAARQRLMAGMPPAGGSLKRREDRKLVIPKS